MRSVVRPFLAVAALAAAAVAGPPEAAAPAGKLTAPAADALDAFRRVAWAERCKPSRTDPAPDGWQERVKTEAALASLDGKDAKTLESLLADEDRFVRAVAARGLGLTADASHAPALVAALAAEKDKLAKIAMIEALARTGGEGALAAVEAQQTPNCDADLSFMVGLARRQLKGARWDVANLRAEFVEAARAAFGAAVVGQPAPELALPSPDRPVNLAPYLGKIVVLAFTHGDRDEKIEKVLQRLAAEKPKLDGMSVQVIVVDPHEKDRTAIWATKRALPMFVFASDPASRAASAYGVAKQVVAGGEWQPSPAWFVIDAKGRLVWKKLGKQQSEHASLGELLPVLDNVARGIAIK